jgi:transposase-like protein
MKAAEDLLLYPLATGDWPVCPKCASPLVLVGFQSAHGQLALSRFRCPDCGRSETYTNEDHEVACFADPTNEI